jgi:hypothetical protein|nr:MAG TPA: hypothetical protein [Caudoviricetes sp.]DAU09364.1 MAG TPA: hypothetical protein [Caudoviricetes sp.]
MSDSARNIDPTEVVLIEYLQTYLPAEKKDDDKILKTSQDIADDLSEMVELTLNQITTIMLDIGYHSMVDKDGRPKWMMMNKD